MYRGDIGHRPVAAAAAASVHPRALRSESDAGRVVLVADALHLRRSEIYAADAEEITITSPVVCLFQWCGRFLNALSSPTVCSFCTCETRCSPTVES
jgi:hypothetical protein